MTYMEHVGLQRIARTHLEYHQLLLVKDRLKTEIIGSKYNHLTTLTGY